MIFKIGVVCVMEGPRYAIGLILVVLLGNFVSMVTEIIIGLLIASTKYIINVLHLIEETMKNHMGLLAIWIALMALMARISIGELIYSSLIRLMNPQSDCVIDLQANCDYICPVCKNFFHKACLDQMLKNRNTCPLCASHLPLGRIGVKKVLSPWLFYYSINNLWQVWTGKLKLLAIIGGWLCLIYWAR